MVPLAVATEPVPVGTEFPQGCGLSGQERSRPVTAELQLLAEITVDFFVQSLC